MYTHVYVSSDDAERLFAAFKGKDKPESFENYIDSYNMCFLPKLGAQLEIVRSSGLFVLKFDHYLPHLPADLINMEIVPVKVEIIRMNSAPTKARAGYYAVPSKGLEATVERIFPTQSSDKRRKPVAPLYAQNIRVTGPSLAKVQEFNSKLSMGFYTRALVNAFE